MADVNISKYRASVVREGSKPASPGFVVSEGQDPVNPPGTNNFVPYTGATANVELGEFGLDSGFVTFDTTPTNIPTDQGTMYWDDTRSTVALIMNGTLQHIGQDTFYYVKNSSGSTIPKGTAVRFAGTNGASGHVLIEPFLANGTYPSFYFMGVTSEEITNGSFGQVINFGELEGINTSGYTAGALLYASTTVAGGFQTTAPVAPNNIVLVAAAVNSKNNGAIVVRPTYGSNINTDEGVKITSGATGDLLQLQAGGLWENKTIDGAGIVTKATGQSITGLKTFADDKLMLATTGNANSTYLTNSAGSTKYQGGFNFFGFNDLNHLYFAKSSNTGANSGVFAWTNTAIRTYTLKDASGTLAFTSDIPSLSGYVQGSGTTNYLPKFTGASTIGNSAITDDGTTVNLISRDLTITRGSYAAFSFGIDQQSTFAFGSTNGRRVAIIRDSTAADNGLQFGYDTVDKTGIIAGSATSAGAGIDFYTYNGSAWGNRARVTASGNLLVGTTTDNGARLQVSGTASISATNGYLYLNAVNSGGNESGIFFQIGGSNKWEQYTAANDSRMVWYSYASSSVVASLSTTGAATFSSSVTAASLISAAATFSNFGSSTAAVVAFADGNTGFFRPALNTLGITTAGSERMRITSSGNVGIGTTSPSQKLHVTGSGDVVTLTETAAGNFAQYRLLSGATNPWIIGTQADFLSNGLVFRNVSDRMLITTSGNVLIGTTTDNGARLQVSGNATATRLLLGTSTASSYRISIVANSNFDTAGILMQDTNTGGRVYTIGSSITTVGNFEIFDGTAQTLRLSINSSGNVLLTSLGTGTVYSNGGTLTNTNPSDFNLKENISPINYGLSEILQLNAVTFNWKNDKIKQGKQYGFIAQEVQKIMPDLVKKGEYLGLDKEAIFTTLVKAIQELKQEIDTLKN